MLRIFVAVTATSFGVNAALAQGTPNFQDHVLYSAQQFNNAFAAKQDMNTRDQQGGYAGIDGNGELNGHGGSNLLTLGGGRSAYRALSARTSDVADPLDWGATCDGASHPLGTVAPGRTLAQWQGLGWPHATDLAEELDSAAIQEAAFAVRPDFGGTVLLPGKPCVVNRTLHLPRPNTTLHGRGMRESGLFTLGGHNFNVIQVDAPQVTLEDFTINPAGQAPSASGPAEVFGIFEPYVPPTTAAGVISPHTFRMIVRHVTMAQVWSGIYSTGGEDLIDGVHLTYLNPAGSGVVFGPDYVDTRRVWNSWIFGAQYGVRLMGSGSTIELINDELPANMHCAAFIPPAGGHIVSITWQHSWCDSSTGVGAIFDATALGSSIARVRINDSWISGSYGDGVQFNGTVRGVSVTGGTELYNNHGDALHLDASIGNAQGFMVNGVKCAANVGSCVGISAGVSGFSILNSDLGPNADFGANGYPIFIASGANDDYIIANNRMRGNANPMQDGGGGGHKSVSGNLQ